MTPSTRCRVRRRRRRTGAAEEVPKAYVVGWLVGWLVVQEERECLSFFFLKRRPNVCEVSTAMINDGKRGSTTTIESVSLPLGQQSALVTSPLVFTDHLKLSEHADSSSSPTCPFFPVGYLTACPGAVPHTGRSPSSPSGPTVPKISTIWSEMHRSLQDVVFAIHVLKRLPIIYAVNK